MSEIIADLSRISNELYKTDQWEEEGATPRMVLEYCRYYGLGCVIIHNEEVIENLPGQEPFLVFAVHEDHAYFYKGTAVRRALAKRKGSDLSLPGKHRSFHKRQLRASGSDGRGTSALAICGPMKRR